MMTTNDTKTKSLLPSGTRVLNTDRGQSGTIIEGHDCENGEWSYLVDAGCGAEIWQRDQFVLMPDPSSDKVLAEIAAKALMLETLETRKRDRLDFHELAVWKIREALERAYAAGMSAGRESAGKEGTR